MSPRLRTALIVAALAALAGVIVAGAAVLSAEELPPPAAPQAAPKPQKGAPPLVLDLGLRTDAEARDLQRGKALYDRGRLASAADVFARHDSLEARVGGAFASWPGGTLDRMEQLAKLYPESGLVQLHLGLARLWANRGDPLAAWQDVLDEEPDTPYAVLAGNLLFPKLPRGLPTFVPSFTAPASVARQPAPRQLEALERAANEGGARQLLLYGVGLQRVGRPLSAADAFERAARLAPNDAEAQVAAAVGRFDKARPEIAFGKLGPLTRRFPNEPTVRFHLGVLLLWTGRIRPAERQFRLAAATRPGSPLAREAARYLETIRRAGG